MCSVNEIIKINTTKIPSSIHRPLLLASRQRHRLRVSISGAGESTMSTNSVRVAAAQMTSITDLASNFATCSRLVKVLSLLPNLSISLI